MLPESWTILRLPRSHWHAQLNNFEWASVTPRALKVEIEKFVAATESGLAPHLVLTGAPGIGKSHLGAGCYRTLSVTFGTELVTWLNVPHFCELVKRSYSDGTDPWADVEGARRLIVLDDLFGRALSPHEADQIVYRLIDTAYRGGSAIIANMNQDVSELPSRLAGHEVSRLLASATIIPMAAGKDWRRK